MRQLPNVVKPRYIDFSVRTQARDGQWVPVRPEPFYPNPISALLLRFRLAWYVFIGRYDALNWEDEDEDEE